MNALPAKALCRLSRGALICGSPVLITMLQLRLGQSIRQLRACKAPRFGSARHWRARCSRAPGPGCPAGLGPRACARQGLGQLHQRRLQPAKVCKSIQAPVKSWKIGSRKYREPQLCAQSGQQTTAAQFASYLLVAARPMFWLF